MSDLYQFKCVDCTDEVVLDIKDVHGKVTCAKCNQIRRTLDYYLGRYKTIQEINDFKERVDRVIDLFDYMNHTIRNPYNPLFRKHAKKFLMLVTNHNDEEYEKLLAYVYGTAKQRKEKRMAEIDKVNSNARTYNINYTDDLTYRQNNLVVELLCSEKPLPIEDFEPKVEPVPQSAPVEIIASDIHVPQEIPNGIPHGCDICHIPLGKDISRCKSCEERVLKAMSKNNIPLTYREALLNNDIKRIKSKRESFWKRIQGHFDDGEY